MNEPDFEDIAKKRYDALIASMNQISSKALTRAFLEMDWPTDYCGSCGAAYFVSDGHECLECL